MSEIILVAAPSRIQQIREKLETQVQAPCRVVYYSVPKEFRVLSSTGRIVYRLKLVEQHQDGGLAEKFNAWALRYNKVVYIGVGAEKCISRLGVAARATFVPFVDFVNKEPV